ncbi:MAG TPA: GerMN domain-containing protein [Acidimicrobiales bacterium]|nr:GerMN domain-containing protein [Acidimicrobiales bacterium]HXB37373.1 GerMN domain-containing protein [Acidimicrobiales bacterium]
MRGREQGRVRLTRLAVLCLLPLAALAAGCALPTQGSPSAIPASRVPFNLLDPHPPTTTTTQPKPSSYVGAKVYFLNAKANNALTPTDRLVSAPAQLPAIITTLVAGPSSGESASGLTTAIPSDVAVLSAAETSPNVVTVNFNTAFGQIAGTATEQAVAQVVTTVVNEIGLGTGVVFEINGTHTSVPIANGSQVAGPVYLLNVTP